MQFISVLFVIAAIVQAQAVCNTTRIEEHHHFTSISDRNMFRECRYEMPDNGELFLDIERYSAGNRADNDARFNITFGDMTVSIHNAYIQVGEQQCAVPMQTKLEQSIWISFRFVDNTMTVQVSPAMTVFFGHCFKVGGVERTTSFHVAASTDTGMEQVLRGVHDKRPFQTDPGQTVIMRKTIHELERRIHTLEEKQEKLWKFVTNANQYHHNKHIDNRAASRQQQKSLDNKVQQVHNQLHNITGSIHQQIATKHRHPWFNSACFCIGCVMIIVLYRLWVLGAKQEKLYRFKL
tara:strand:+ start:4629 stop:5507 length:879 start_codon:yes stop_codon:yes gene_type:complete